MWLYVLVVCFFLLLKKIFRGMDVPKFVYPLQLMGIWIVFDLEHL